MADARDRQRHFLRDAGWLPLALAAKRFATVGHDLSLVRQVPRTDGLLEKINHSLVMADRERVGREASPSGAIFDSQSVKTTEAGGPRGYDAGKKIKGRKRHALVDTDGRGLVLEAHPASIQDRDGGGPLLCASRGSFPFIEKVFADSGDAGEKVATATVIAVGIRAQKPRSGRLRRPTAPLGRGALLRLDQPQPATGKGLRGHHRLGPRLPLRRLRHAPRPQIGPSRMTLETDSKLCTAKPRTAWWACFWSKAREHNLGTVKRNWFTLVVGCPAAGGEKILPLRPFLMTGRARALMPWNYIGMWVLRVGTG